MEQNPPKRPNLSDTLGFRVLQQFCSSSAPCTAPSQGVIHDITTLFKGLQSDSLWELMHLNDPQSVWFLSKFTGLSGLSSPRANYTIRHDSWNKWRGAKSNYSLKEVWTCKSGITEGTNEKQKFYTNILHYLFIYFHNKKSKLLWKGCKISFFLNNDLLLFKIHFFFKFHISKLEIYNKQNMSFRQKVSI